MVRSKAGFLKRGIPLPVSLVLVFLFSLLLGDFVPLYWKELLYSVSLLIKSGLVFTLPLIIFSFLASSLIELRGRGAVVTVLIILSAVCLSNFNSTLVAYAFGKLLVGLNAFPELAKPTSIQELRPLWDSSFSPWISNDKAMLLGVVFGVTVLFSGTKSLAKISHQMKEYSQAFLNRIFVPLVPLFVLGFSLKMQHEQVLDVIVKDYLWIFLYILGIQISYLSVLYFVSAGLSWKKFLFSVKNVVPAIVSGFSTMSSMVSLPLSLEAAEKNTQNPQVSRLVVPATVNNHLVGDSIFIPLMAIVFLASSGGVGSASGLGGLSFGSYLEFAFYFVLAKFSVAAVPGGGIIVMLPILERTLGLSADMLSLITALYILFDPFITACNVAGNGSLCILISKVISKLPFKQT